MLLPTVLKKCRSHAGKAIVLIAAAVLGLLVWCVTLLYQQRLAHYRHQAERELQAINQLQVHSVGAWREQRLTDAMALSDDVLLAQALSQWLRQPSQARQVLLTERLRILQERSNYTAVHLVDTQGRLLLPQDTAWQMPGPELQALHQTFTTAQTGVVEPRRDDYFAFPFFSLLAPIFDGAHPLGAVWLVIDVRTSLFPLLQIWPTSSETAESSIVRRDGDDVLFLSPLRHRTGAEFTLRIPLTQHSDPAVQALAGARGIFYSRDYRGKDTMAMLSAVPGSPWYMVSKIDTEEIFADTRVREGLALSLPVSLGLLLTGIIFAFAQRRGRLQEQALKVALQRNMLWLEGAQKAASIGYFAYDAAADAFTLSSMARTIFGWEDGNVMLRHQWIKLIHPDNRQEVVALHEQTIALRQPVQIQYGICRANDQQIRWVQVWAEYEAPPSPRQVARLTGTVQDITERKQTEQELADYRAVLEQKVRLDPLTQVANRRALDEHVATQWQRAMRNHAALSLLMIDVDHFKRYNDHYGHIEGDECLRRVAHMLAGMVSRADELVARYGGEEFAIVLPDSEASQALALAQKMCAAVVGAGITHADSPTASWVTISIGVACIHPIFGSTAQAYDAVLDAELAHALDGALAQALFEQADAALYAAKQQGRNRAVLQAVLTPSAETA
ncbi:diguanylate cyclase domain-containing protein [Simplicispira psychrophila]|uniref:diguanylate cyclase domain-containing protein n=1 Tax=Simplicispira psychrophila TaxID=80882 RepID=UPI00068E72D4|nr:diguanylate cyclase [Simplicispira psychrophila]